MWHEVASIICCLVEDLWYNEPIAGREDVTAALEGRDELLAVEFMDMEDAGRDIDCDEGMDVPLISRYLRIVGLNGAVKLAIQ